MLALTGCRESIVGPDPALPPDPVTPVNVSSMYLKGPTEMEVGETRNFRGEPLRDAVHYNWAVSGSADVTNPSSSSDRHFDLRAETPGLFLVSIVAFDADGDLIAAGERAVVVR